MKNFRIVPEIKMTDSCEEFLNFYEIGAGDLVFASQGTKKRVFGDKESAALFIDYRKYGSGEPTDLMVEGIYQEIGTYEIKRVFAIGGGTILDVAKLFALKTVSPVVELFEHKLPLEKACPLILVPTTCGTGSEVTNISILELTVKNTKMGLADDALYADAAVLIPELLEALPYKFFATSSIDALVHAVESYTSPKASAFSQAFSLMAMDKIITGYKAIALNGPSVRQGHLADFLLASAYAGIAFGNAGCAAVHAMSYPLGAGCHVPHGEANYVMFTEVYKMYKRLSNKGSLAELQGHLAELLGCDVDAVFDTLEFLLAKILSKKSLQEYGVAAADIPRYIDIVLTQQSRLMQNNYTELGADQLREIYQKLY